MSRFDELKKQYPELNTSVLDVLKQLDKSSTYKYLPLICKIFSEKYKPSPYPDFSNMIEDWKTNLKNKGFNCEKLSLKELIFYVNLLDNWPQSHFEIFHDFMTLMEKGLLEKKDVTSYSSLDDMRGEITLASLKEIKKSLEREIIKEYEDDKWLILRPLTFLSSCKYGAATKWCTTYEKDKQFFEKYWRTGILVYFINKKSGYRFAGFKSLDESHELSFWTAEDHRVDFLDLEVDDYLFNICRKIFKSKFTNKNLCTAELQENVHKECINAYILNNVHQEDVDIPVQHTQ